jgi:N-sulfoglucosamine sulfohydrolase
MTSPAAGPARSAAPLVSPPYHPRTGVRSAHLDSVMRHPRSLRNRLRALLCLCVAALLPPALGAAPPNILFILTEDQGAHLGALGTPGIQTPHMDALAKSGVLFRHAYVAYSVCSASKAALYTSLHNHTNGILNNTVNYPKPAAKLTEAETRHVLYRTNRIHDGIPTLVERLKAAGYYQGVTHKLHVAPVEKFPYDEFIPHSHREAAAGFIRRATRTGKPWHLFFNIPNSHRPFPKSDQVKIRVHPAAVKLPAFLPDTPVIRQDWAEYLAAIEEADHLVGEALGALRDSGQEANTIIVFMGDHGPCFAHGKMSLHDLGLRVPLAIRAPGAQSGVVSDALASELDLTPTLLDLAGLAPLAKSHGMTLRPVLEGNPAEKRRAFAFAEISNRGPLPNDGMQERCIQDQRWKLIYREKTETGWRQVNADSIQMKLWGNRSYNETLRVKDQFPEAFRILAEMHPQALHGKVPALELYDLQNDPNEMRNLATDPAHRGQRDRLYAALRQWCQDTADSAIQPPATLPD